MLSMHRLNVNLFVEYFLVAPYPVSSIARREIGKALKTAELTRSDMSQVGQQRTIASAALSQARQGPPFEFKQPTRGGDPK
jgi:hypothetical protein